MEASVLTSCDHSGPLLSQFPKFCCLSAHCSVILTQMIPWCQRLHASTKMIGRSTIEWPESGQVNMPCEIVHGSHSHFATDETEGRWTSVLCIDKEKNLHRRTKRGHPNTSLLTVFAFLATNYVLYLQGGKFCFADQFPSHTCAVHSILFRPMFRIYGETFRAPFAGAPLLSMTAGFGHPLHFSPSLMFFLAHGFALLSLTLF